MRPDALAHSLSVAVGRDQWTLALRLYVALGPALRLAAARGAADRARTAGEAAAHLGVPVRTFWRWLKLAAGPDEQDARPNFQATGPDDQAAGPNFPATRPVRKNAGPVRGRGRG